MFGQKPCIRYVLKIFSPILSCLFINLTLSFATAELLTLIRSNQTFFFMICTLDIVSEYSSQNPRSHRFSSAFFFKFYSFAFHIQFLWSILISVKHVRSSLFLQMDTPMFQHHLLKETILYALNCLCAPVRDYIFTSKIISVCMYFWILSLLIYVFIHLAIPCCLG